jgi:hypothetical protein
MCLPFVFWAVARVNKQVSPYNTILQGIVIMPDLVLKKKDQQDEYCCYNISDIELNIAMLNPA